MHEINAQKLNTVAWQFNHSYTKLPKDFFVEQLPVKVSNPKLLLLNEPLLKSLGLDKEALSREAWGNIFSGNELPEKAHPIAEAYAGHQFGHFAILGDGRAVLLGEHVGTFQFASTLNDTNKLKALADYTIDRHYPECKAKDNPYLAFLNAVIERQALLLSQWMHVGFIHGVMNTDNMSISGETIDYGPCAFMDRYHPETVFSSIDRHGRYAYANQPPIAQWNLARFAETLIPLIDQNTDKSIELASQSVNDFSDQFQRAWLRGMRQKLGLFNEGPNNIELINELLVLMQKNKADYTLTFRHLSSDAILKDTIFKDTSFKVWYKNWIHCIQKQKEGEETSKLMMLKHNPAVIPRNYLVEKALSLAVVDQDYRFLNDFIAALLNPYEDSKVFGEPALEEDKSYQTFCGT